MKSPQMRIKYARLLDPYFRDLFEYKKLIGVIDANREYPSLEQIVDKVKVFNDVWLTRQPVVEYIQDVLSLDFRAELHDVYIIGVLKGAISTPTLIGSNTAESEFLDILTHELIHVLLSDNKQKIDLSTILPTMYPNETPKCRIHIIVHAMLTKIYLEFLKEPERLSTNIEHDKNYPDYSRAWDIVKEEGYANIIEQFKTHCCV